MNAPDVFQRLRDLIDETDLTLVQIANRSKVSYQKLYRFRTADKSLSLPDAESVFKTLTGKSFIQLPEADDHAL